MLLINSHCTCGRLTGLIQYITFACVSAGTLIAVRVGQEPFQTADTCTSAARQSLRTWQGHQEVGSQTFAILQGSSPPFCSLGHQLWSLTSISLEETIHNIGAFHLHHSWNGTPNPSNLTAAPPKDCITLHTPLHWRHEGKACLWRKAGWFVTVDRYGRIHLNPDACYSPVKEGMHINTAHQNTGKKG